MTRRSGPAESVGTSADLWFSDTGNNVVDAHTEVASGAGFNDASRLDSANTATAEAGSPFSFEVTTTGTPVPSIKKKGKLPKGLTFTNNANGTATISGTPTSTKRKPAEGLYHVTLTATFGKGKGKIVSTQAWSLNVVS